MWLKFLSYRIVSNGVIGFRWESSRRSENRSIGQYLIIIMTKNRYSHKPLTF